MQDEEKAAEMATAKSEIGHIKEKLREFVTKAEFQPIKLLVYGATGMALTAVMGALLKIAVDKSASITAVLP